MECAAPRPAQRRTAPPPRPPPPGSSAAQRGATVQEDAPAFKVFQKVHDKAYATVQKGLTADEEGDTAAAERYYANSLALLDEVLATDCENMPGVSASGKDSAKEMQQKMQKTRLQISYRLESMREGEQSGLPDTTLDSTEAGVRLPSYDEAVSSSHTSLTADAALGDSIMAAEYPSLAGGPQVSTQGTELFSLPEGVQIFHITREGYVSAPSYPTSLHVVKLREGDVDTYQASDSPPVFLQVGEWFYPLIPNASPVLHSTFGAYLFPDLSPNAAGSSVGLMLPETVTPEERQFLEDILRSYSAVQEQQTHIQPEDLVLPSAPLEREEPSAPMVEPGEVTAPRMVTRTGEVSESVKDQSTSGKISQGILVASKWISWGVGKGAEKAGELISYGSTKLRDRLRPTEQAKPVDPRVQTGMVYARKATHVAVTVSAFVVSKLGEATMALGRQVAPHIRKKGEELMPKSMKSEKSKSTLDGVIEVAASGLQGFGTVYVSLEGAAKALARSLANETVAAVQHKYGDEAGKLTENTVYAAGNLALAAYNVDNLGVKALAKRAAKDTGKAVLQDIQEKKRAEKEANGHMNGASYDGSGGSGYGDNKKRGQPRM